MASAVFGAGLIKTFASASSLANGEWDRGSEMQHFAIGLGRGRRWITHLRCKDTQPVMRQRGGVRMESTRQVQ
jgi:hypothetical protein